MKRRYIVILWYTIQYTWLSLNDKNSQYVLLIPDIIGNGKNVKSYILCRGIFFTYTLAARNMPGDPGMSWNTLDLGNMDLLFSIGKWWPTHLNYSKICLIKFKIYKQMKYRKLINYNLL